MLRPCSQIATSSRVLLPSSAVGRSARRASTAINRRLTTSAPNKDTSDHDKKEDVAAWSALVDTVSQANATRAKQTESLLTDYLAGGGEAPKAVVRVPLFNSLRRTADVPSMKSNKTSNYTRTLSTSDEIDERIRKDKESLHLIKEVNRHNEAGHARRTIKACAALKKRLNQLQVAFDYKEALKPPRSVYDNLLTSLAQAGELDACEEAIDDMRAAGFPIGKQELDSLLLAAVQSGNEDYVSRILDQISAASIVDIEGVEEKEADVPLQSANASRASDAKISESTDTFESHDSPHGQIISSKHTKYWTATTFRTMLLHCQSKQNLEYALALLASASQRSARQRRGTSSSSRQSFLGKVLTPETCILLITLMRECRHARLAADFALWTEERITLRKHSLRTWANVLQCCAHEDWWPGVELAWNKVVTVGLVPVDEGLLLSVLRCASRARKADFIKQALDVYQRSSPSSVSVQEWHLSPLLEAQCAAHDFDGAIRTATKIARTATGTSASDRLVALVKAASSSIVDLRGAYHAFVTIGTDTTPDGGVTNETLIALIRAANALRSHSTALGLYATRHYLRNENASDDAQLVPIPVELKDISISAHDGDSSTSIEASLDLLVASEQKYRLEADTSATKRQSGSSRPSSIATVVPTITTYNALLSTAIDSESKALGRFVFDQINKERCPADETTYERAIILSVTQPSYEDGFKLLGECKLRHLRPTRSSYRALATRCLKEDDDRWINLGREMIDHGHYPGKELHEALVRGNWIDSRKLLPFDVSFKNAVRFGAEVRTA